MIKQFFCNNCNRPIAGNKTLSRLFCCDDCDFVLAISDGQINSISIMLDANLSFRSGHHLFDVYAYFISNGSIVNLGNILILPNIKDDVIEIKEYIDKLNRLLILA